MSKTKQILVDGFLISVLLAEANAFNNFFASVAKPDPQ